MFYEEHGERRVILNLMVLLYNFQCSCVGHNMILSSFMHSENYYYGHTWVPTAVANLGILISNYNYH